MTAKYILINSYSQKNMGDAAILNCTLDLISQIPNSKVAVSTRYHKENHHLPTSVAILPPLIKFATPGEKNNSLRYVEFLLDSLVMFALGTLFKKFPSIAQLLLRLYKRELAKFLGDSSYLFITSGGGYLYSNKKLFNFSFMHSCFSIIIAKKFKHHIVSMPQSIGPIHKKSDEFMLKRCLSHLDEIIVREEYSKTFVRDLLGIEAKLCPDIVFTKSLISPKKFMKSSLEIRLIVMDWTWAREVGRSELDKYIDFMSSLVDSLEELGYVVVIGGHSCIPEQNQDDFEIARKISEKTLRRIKVMDESNLHHLYHEYGTSHAVISTRLHGAIMAMSQSTPSLVLGYQPKARGTLKLLDLEDFFLDVQTATVSDIVASLKTLENEWKNIYPKIQAISSETKEFLISILEDRFL